MKIVHISPSCTYVDGWGYQENLLCKYQKKLGYDVTLITTNLGFEKAKRVVLPESEFVSKDGFYVIRRKIRKIGNATYTQLFSYMPVYSMLKEIKPDIIFYHGIASVTIFQAIKYKKQFGCHIFQDNHADYCNGKVHDTFKGRTLKKLWHIMNSYTSKYVDRVYGVTPWRVQYAMDYCGVPQEKLDLLCMGADDEKIHFNQMPKLRNIIRKDLSLNDNDFVVITGGKIDRSKNIHLLMRAVADAKRVNLKLIVFGEPSDEMKDEIQKLSEDEHIRNIGWIASDKVYDYFLASDLACFPGTHSVLWEQACGCGIPILVKDWEGMHHVDLGGNCIFLRHDSEKEIQDILIDLYNYPEKYHDMKKIAEEKGISTFSYEQIAKRAVEIEA